MIAGGIVKKGLMVISLKANNQSFGPPSASKTLSRLVIVKALKGLNNPLRGSVVSLLVQSVITFSDC